MIQQLGAAVNWLSDQVRPYSFQVATAIVATLLFIYGESIHRLIRDKLKLKNKPFVVRLCTLIALCAFGYGALTVSATALLSRLIATSNGLIVAPGIVVVFIFIGLLAERRRQL